MTTDLRVAAKRFALSLSAAAVIGATLLPAPGSAAVADGKGGGKAGFAGYSVTASGTPQKIEIYEPTIPLPASPQAELSYGYTAVIADSASSKSRASFLWPGGPVGEGFKTIVENLGLPPELSGPLGENGYPVQVNAVFPGGPESDSDEPVPGTVQRASAGEGTARADNGTSTDGEVDDGGDDGDGGGDGGGGPLPHIPGLPDLPGLPGLSGGLGGGQSVPTSTGTASGAGEPDPAPALPPELAALVDLGSYSSTSLTKNDVGATAYGRARASASDIELLGGLVTIEGVSTVAEATSDGTTGKPAGSATYGDIVAFGQRFVYGDDGYEAAGNPVPIPGLPDDAGAALGKIGLKISTPQPTYTRDGDAASATVPGLVLDFDLTVLRSQLGPVTEALNEVVGQIPSETGQLKSLVQAAANLSPRIVFELGYATASVDTSQAIVIPPIEVPDVPAQDTPPNDGGGGAVTPPNSGPPAGPSDSGPVDAAPVGDTAPADAAPALTPQAAQQALPGLPGLFSIPGLLLYGGLVGGAAAGFFVRRLGLMALGQAGSCPHGLDSGLPDLRKA